MLGVPDHLASMGLNKSLGFVPEISHSLASDSMLCRNLESV